MKFPRFIAGLFTGIAICVCIAAFCYWCIIFPAPIGHYQSPTIIFYVTPDHPQFAEYELLGDRGYWEKLSLDAESVAKKFLEKKGFSNDVSVYCVGSPQEYRIYYSFSESTSLYELFANDETRKVIIDFIDSSYRSHLDKIIAD